MKYNGCIADEIHRRYNQTGQNTRFGGVSDPFFGGRVALIRQGPVLGVLRRLVYLAIRPEEASRGVGDLGAISTSRSGLEIAPRSLTPSEAALGRSHVYQRAERAEGISLAPGIVPKGQSRRARRPAAHRHQPPPGAPKPTSGGFWRGVTRQYRANRVVPQAVPHPYMMHMLGRGQWARQCSMRSVARLSGEFATSIGC